MPSSWATGLCEDLIKQNKGESRYSTRIRTCAISNSDSKSKVLDHGHRHFQILDIVPCLIYVSMDGCRSVHSALAVFGIDWFTDGRHDNLHTGPVNSLRTDRNWDGLVHRWQTRQFAYKSSQVRVVMSVYNKMDGCGSVHSALAVIGMDWFTDGRHDNLHTSPVK
ncbi:hypothetical protein J6590_028996 [Homalodisca vitripennis]|nr:hypothetical protein J6590_028996 [Homalodisca vitripennis]